MLPNVSVPSSALPAKRFARCACSPSLRAGRGPDDGAGDIELGDWTEGEDEGAGEFAKVDGNENESRPLLLGVGTGGGDCPNDGAKGLFEPKPVG